MSAAVEGRCELLHHRHLLCAVTETCERGGLDALLFSGRRDDLRPILNHLENGFVRLRPNGEVGQGHLEEFDGFLHLRHGVGHRTGVAGTGASGTG